MYDAIWSMQCSASRMWQADHVADMSRILTTANRQRNRHHAVIVKPARCAVGDRPIRPDGVLVPLHLVGQYDPRSGP